MYEFRVTKYDPQKRHETGYYTDQEEWTDFGQVGKNVSLEEYLLIEKAYIDSAIEFIASSGSDSLTVVSLENHRNTTNLKEHDLIPLDSLDPVLRSLLRCEFWCRLESELGFIHIGWDYYMYIGVSRVNESVISNTQKRGLFVEEFISPYHPEDC